MNLFVYSDESGVLDKYHNDFYVFGGLIFLEKTEKDIWSRKYQAKEQQIYQSEGWDTDIELKACSISVASKRKLFQLLKPVHKFGVVIRQKQLRDEIFNAKKSKQRYLDYAYKLALKRALEDLTKSGIIDPDKIESVYIFTDEHTTATNGLYELEQNLEKEFKIGMFSRDFQRYFPPLFPKMKSVQVKYVDSKHIALVRSADIIANRLLFEAKKGTESSLRSETFHILRLP